MVKLIRLFTVKREKAINIRAWHPILLVSIERTPDAQCLGTFPSSRDKGWNRWANSSLMHLLLGQRAGNLSGDRRPVRGPKDHRHQPRWPDRRLASRWNVTFPDKMAPWGLATKLMAPIRERLVQHKDCLRSMERMICIVAAPERLCRCFQFRPQIKL